MNINKILKFGKYEWRILDVQDDKALIITEYLYERSSYHEKRTPVTWETCSLRQYLNDEFLQNFTEEEREKIVETQINNPQNLWYETPGGNNTRDKVFLLSLEEADRYFGNSEDYLNIRRTGWGNNAEHDAKHGHCLDNAHNIDRIANACGFFIWGMPMGYNGPFRWWLRSPGSESNQAAEVHSTGVIRVCGKDAIDSASFEDSSGGVRPALWLKGYQEYLEAYTEQSEILLNEQKLIKKFPSLATAQKPVIYYGGYAYFTFFEQDRPNDWRYEYTWVTYRTKADGTGELEKFGSTDKDADPGGERITGQHYISEDDLNAIMELYGPNVFFEN